MRYFLTFIFCTQLAFSQILNESLILEAQDAIDNGLDFLRNNKNDDNSWGEDNSKLALSALAITAFASGNLTPQDKKIVNKVAQYIAKYSQDDGAIYVKEKPRYINYTTCLALVALFLVDSEKYAQIGLNARRFLKKSQFTNQHHYGGIGYGSNKNQADLSNTQFALEALHLTKSLERESSDINEATETKLAWERAKVFLSRCQKISSNKMTWVKENKFPQDDGGAIYSPRTSKSKHKQTLRTYGSMTYALLKSMIYAKLTPNDKRIKAILSWVSNNYTLEENPNVGQQGYYYYLNMFTKALHVSKQELITTKDGKTHAWREEVIQKILNLQKGDGSWVNSNGRWRESNPLLVTAYTIISLRYALGKYNYN